MTIKPLNNKIKLQLTEETIGGIKTDSVSEKGVILAVGEMCKNFSKTHIGRTLYFKAWAVDVITEGTEKHYFLSDDSDAICGINEVE